MPKIDVSDELATSIEIAAAHRGCSPQELLQFLFSQMRDETVEEQSTIISVGAGYTRSARERVQQGIDASLQGDLVPHEEIEAFFEDWKRELPA